MAVFKTKRTIPVQNVNIQDVADSIERIYRDKDFEVKVEPTAQGCLISLTKGGMFKAALGMKTALNLKLKLQSDALDAEASVGVFGMQVLPSLITYYIAWPVMLTQIWGLVKQSKLDDEVIDAVEKIVKQQAIVPAEIAENRAFCTKCGAAHAAGAAFCSSCGEKLN